VIDPPIPKDDRPMTQDDTRWMTIAVEMLSIGAAVLFAFVRGF